MHPDLYSVPGINYEIRTYGFCIGVGIVVAIWIGVIRAKRVGADPSAVTSLAIVGLIAGIIGSRGMHAVHYLWDAIRSGELGGGELLQLKVGGEILGGVLLGTAACMVYLAITRKSILVYLDIGVPALIIAMGIGRIGCLMFGCCWGATCTTPSGDKALPWAVRFPYGSPPYVEQWRAGELEVPDDLTWKVPENLRKGLPGDEIPIAREILADYDIDSEPVLGEWAEKMATLRRVEKANPDDERVGELRAEISGILQQVPERQRGDLALKLLAAMHLRQLTLEDDGEAARWDDLRILAGTQRLWVHPTQVYDAVALILLFFLLSAIFYRRERIGIVAAWAMMLYSVNRFLQEMIRTDNPHDVFGLTISQFICIVIFVGGVLFAVILRQWGPRAPAITG